ncbi:MAG: hypothetical protein D6725_08250 [Planctomycetota bacterium]|nr:MAG: hypothetical protein D6725_08250 [Planctomycetota bacterium]
MSIAVEHTSKPADEPAGTGAEPSSAEDAAARLERELYEQVLVDKSPPWFRMSRRAAGWATLLAVGLILLSRLPLHHTDLWGHLAYGRWMWQNGQVPRTEPLMPLAAGVPFVDTQWLPELLGYGLYRTLGPTALMFVHALMICGVLALLLQTLDARTAHAGFTLLALVAFLWLERFQLVIARPQTLGLLCFATLITLLVRRNRHAFWLVPLLFLVWANSHGSFSIGLAALTASLVGDGLDAWRRSGRVAALWRARRVRRKFVLLELAVIATLINPYGLLMHLEVLRVAGNPNLADLVEWDPLVIRSGQGQAFFVVALLLILLNRFSPRRMPAAEALWLLGLGVLTLWYSRGIVWWGFVAAMTLGGDAHAVWLRLRRRKPRMLSCRREGKWMLVTAGVAWIAFALTPFGNRVLHGRQPAIDRVVDDYTPVEAVAHLRQHPPVGQVFNTYEWGDYLLFAGPPGVEVFVASHAHLIPREVWVDYLATASVRADWDAILDQYGVNTVLVDYRYRRALIRRLEDAAATWKKTYDDGRAAVFTRIEPIRDEPADPAAAPGQGNP